MPIVNNEILIWARETAGFSVQEAAHRLGMRDTKYSSVVQKLIALESGKTAPSRPILVRMSKQYRRPLLTFYLAEIPPKGDRGQDFRTLPEGQDPSTDALIDALIRNLRARQSMVRAVMEDEDEAARLLFIGSSKMEDGLEAVVASLRNTIPMTLQEFRAQPDAGTAFKLLRSQVEELGIFVLLIGNLGSHHTAIGLKAFRGFALADDVAPFIVINDQDAKAAWAFTLLHEITHLWLGATGISGSNSDSQIERFCNDVASEYLLPDSELNDLRIADVNDAGALKAAISGFAENANVSRSMVAYRLYRRGAFDLTTWQQLSAEFRQEWIKWKEESRQQGREQEGGPSYFVVKRHRVGNHLVELVRRMIGAGALTTTKAGQVLGVKPKNVQALVAADSNSYPNRILY